MTIFAKISRAEFERLWNSGISGTEIGARLGISETSVRSIRKSFGLTTRRHGTVLHTPETVLEVKRLWASGLTGTEVARQMGPNWTRGMVLGMVHRYGLGEGRAAKDGAPTANPPRTPRLPKPPKAPKPPRAEKSAPAPKPFDLSKSKTDSTPEQRAEKAAAGQAIIAAANDAANDNSVLLMERRFGQCAWPVGQPDRPAQQLCCGGPVPADANRSIANYCVSHAQRAVARVLTGGAPDSAKYERAMRRWAA